MHSDHLGSVDAVTNVGGTVAERRSYEPFGQARSVDTLEPISNANQLEHFGFTGHEEDGELGLVNMRGRLYDPKLGRFLSADPFVQNPGHSQSWNRYSYIQNSPLNGTDPSGFLCDELNRASICGMDFPYLGTLPGTGGPPA
jgi:RHS repeat-associated protein